MAEELKAQGIAAFTAGNFSDAVKHFTDAIDLAPTNHVLYSNRSAAHASILNYTDALSDAKKTVELKSDWSKAYIRLGAAHLGLRDYHDAIDAYQKGLEIDPNNEALKSGLVNALFCGFPPESAQHPSPLGHAFSGAEMWANLTAHPSTRGFLKRPGFVAMMHDIQRNPIILNLYMGDQRVAQAFRVLLNVKLRTRPEDTEVEHKEEQPVEKEELPKKAEADAEPETAIGKENLSLKKELSRSNLGSSSKESRMARRADLDWMSEMLQGLIYVTQNLVQNQAAQAAQAPLALARHEPNYFKRVSEAKPPTYDGSSEPRDLENWIWEIEKVFDAMGCPEEYKVVSGAYYLRDQADLWWLYSKDAFMASSDPSWASFTRALRAKFYPAHLQKQKTNEFYNLNMGDKSVEEYFKQFMELLRFVPDIANDEERKIMRFEQGLTLDLLAKVRGDVYPTLDTIYRKAAFIYGVQQRQKEQEAAVKRKEPPTRHSSRVGDFKRPNHGGNFNQHYQQRAVRQGTSARAYHCKWCNKNHPGTDCQGNLVTCRACRGLGHRQFECTTPRGTPQQSYQRPQSRPSMAPTARPPQKGNASSRPAPPRQNPRPVRVNAMTIDQEPEPIPTEQSTYVISD